LADLFKYRVDHVGSLPCPQELLQARAAHRSGAVDDAGLRAAEDEAIAAVLRFQKKLDTTQVTDGEYRRPTHESVVTEQVEGFTARADAVPTGPVLQLPWAVTGKLKAPGRLAQRELSFIQQSTRHTPKITLPAPGYLALGCFDPAGPYADPAELGAALAAVLRAEIEALLADGLPYLLLFDIGYGALLDAAERARLREQRQDPDELLAAKLAADTAALQGLDVPEDTRIGIFLSRGGGFAGSTGAFDEQAARTLVDTLPVHRYVVEYHDDQAMTAAPLEILAGRKDVCLGVVPVGPPLGDIDETLARIDSAVEILGDVDLGLSTNKPFAPVPDAANQPSLDYARAVIERVEILATMIWGNEA
jgi:5-methyltetrahydropteroyltriglutamate--homocysteine methyltransferase